MGVSLNGGTPKSSVLIGFSIINHPFWGTPIFGNTEMSHDWNNFKCMISLFHPKWGEPLMQQCLLYPSLCCWIFAVVFCHPPLKKQMSKHSSKNHQTTNHEPRQKTCQTITKYNPKQPLTRSKITTKADLLTPLRHRWSVIYKKNTTMAKTPPCPYTNYKVLLRV